MIKRVAMAITLAIANSPYYIMPRFRNKYDIYKMTPPHCVDECIASLVSADIAEDECERLNYEYVARMAIEALKPATDDMQNRYFIMATNEGHTPISAAFENGRWERSIDAILKE